MTYETNLQPSLFDSFPEPVILVSSKSISYFNPSAALLFSNPSLKIGSPVPAQLAPYLPADQTESNLLSPDLSISGKNYHVSLSALDGGFLFVLRPGEPSRGLLLQFMEVLVSRLRTMLNPLLSAASLLTPAIEATKNPDYVMYLSIVNLHHYRLLRILGSLTESIRLLQPAPEDDQPFQNTELVSFLRNITEISNGLARLSGHDVRFSSSEERLITAVYGGQIERLLLNLISNALKFTPPGGSVLVNLSLENNLALLTVSDQGEGLGPSAMATAFSHFEAGVEPVAKPKGLGLGLTLVRRIAVRHGGSVMLESRPGIGTKVIVSLPVKALEDTTLHAYRPQVDYSGGFSNILVELSDAMPPEAFLPENLE